MVTETRGPGGSSRTGYMVSRGLAMSGSRDPYSGDHGDGARR